MILLTDLDEGIKNEFCKLGIEDNDAILSIINGFDLIAEIGYTIYTNGKYSKEYDKETENNPY